LLMSMTNLNFTSPAAMRSIAVLTYCMSITCHAAAAAAAYCDN
jgi:hypothetical protein